MGLELNKLENLPIEKALEKYLYEKSIKNESILIKSAFEFVENIKNYSKLDKILLAEKLENIINKDNSEDSVSKYTLFSRFLIFIIS